MSCEYTLMDRMKNTVILHLWQSRFKSTGMIGRNMSGAWKVEDSRTLKRWSDGISWLLRPDDFWKFTYSSSPGKSVLLSLLRKLFHYLAIVVVSLPIIWPLIILSLFFLSFSRFFYFFLVLISFAKMFSSANPLEIRISYLNILRFAKTDTCIIRNFAYIPPHQTTHSSKVIF